jgi:hypothetical protein
VRVATKQRCAAMGRRLADRAHYRKYLRVPANCSWSNNPKPRAIARYDLRVQLPLFELDVSRNVFVEAIACPQDFDSATSAEVSPVERSLSFGETNETVRCARSRP